MESTPVPPNNSSSRANTFAALLGIFSCIGFFDATYLTIKHYTGGIIPCTIFDGCDVVTHSAYSMFYGIPVALLGAIFYLIMLVTVILFFEKKNIPENVVEKADILKFASLWSIAGFIASLGFFYIQAAVLHSFCIYCLGSAASSTLLFITGMTYLACKKRV